jgi:hypothetical protein
MAWLLCRPWRIIAARIFAARDRSRVGKVGHGKASRIICDVLVHGGEALEGIIGRN